MNAAIELVGEMLVPDLSGALFVPAHGALIVADLHLEKGSSFLAKGVPLPPFDSAAGLARLDEACARLKPDCVIALGDFFHDGEAAERIGSDDMARLQRLIGAHDWIWVLGNHDPAPPRNLGGRHATSLKLGALTLRHEPSPRADGEIAGHLHPVATVHAGGRRIRRRCFVASARRMVLPAFGAYAGGLNVLDPAVSGLFGGEFRAWMIGSDALYPVSSWRLIGETA